MYHKQAIYFFSPHIAKINSRSPVPPGADTECLVNSIFVFNKMFNAKNSNNKNINLFTLIDSPISTSIDLVNILGDDPKAAINVLPILKKFEIAFGRIYWINYPKLPPENKKLVQKYFTPDLIKLLTDAIRNADSVKPPGFFERIFSMESNNNTLKYFNTAEQTALSITSTINILNTDKTLSNSVLTEHLNFFKETIGEFKKIKFTSLSDDTKKRYKATIDRCKREINNLIKLIRSFPKPSIKIQQTPSTKPSAKQVSKSSAKQVSKPSTNSSTVGGKKRKSRKSKRSMKSKRSRKSRKSKRSMKSRKTKKTI